MTKSIPATEQPMINPISCSIESRDPWLPVSLLSVVSSTEVVATVTEEVPLEESVPSAESLLVMSVIGVDWSDRKCRRVLL